MSLNNDPCVARPTLNDLNRVELNYFPFFISQMEVEILLMTYLRKYAFPVNEKSINVKVFNMTTRINEAKALVKHISCDYKWKFNSTTCNSIQKWNNSKHSECKKRWTAKKRL